MKARWGDRDGQSAVCRGGAVPLSSGMPWRDLPERFGDFRDVHLRFWRWSKRACGGACSSLGADADNEYAMIDAPSCEPTSTARGAKKEGEATTRPSGAAAAGLSTKIHATVDALGNPTGFHLTAGQAHDLEGADALLKDTQPTPSSPTRRSTPKPASSSRCWQAGKTVVIPLARTATCRATTTGIFTRRAT